MSPTLTLFISAYLIMLIARSKDIQTIFKSESQRTKQEICKVNRGLRKAIVLEIILFVPASAFLLLMISPLVIPDRFLKPNSSDSSFYALLGVGSYGFPFAALRQLVARIALKTLTEFSNICQDVTYEEN